MKFIESAVKTQMLQPIRRLSYSCGNLRFNVTSGWFSFKDRAQMIR